MPDTAKDKPDPIDATAARKDHHLDLVLSGTMAMSRTAGFDAIEFEHNALPEIDFDGIDLSCMFLNRRLALPFLISSMTGGAERAAAINEALAEAAQELSIALGVGSQRVAIEGSSGIGLGHNLRKLAPDIPLLANLGAVQLNFGFGVSEAQRAIDMIEADALILHLNPLQEALQPEGDRNWGGLLKKIGILVRTLPSPIVVKEVGCGISGTLARQLADEGVRFIDVAGAGGTSWAKIEGSRSADPIVRTASQTFAEWGIPTARAIADVRAAAPEVCVLASGGLKTGLDAAKAIRLGASLCGLAAGTLREATHSADAVITRFKTLAHELQIACFCTGSASLSALRTARLMSRQA